MNLFDKITWINSRIIPWKSYTDNFGSASSFLWNTPTQSIVPQTYQPSKAPIVQKQMSYNKPWYQESVNTRAAAPTESSFYKAVQWWADLFSGIQKRLWETAQEDISRGQVDIEAKKKQFVGDMLQKWYKKEDIFTALDKLSEQWEFTAKSNFATRTISGFESRMWEMWNTTENLSNIQNPLLRTGAWIASYGWDVVATAFQPVVSALEPIVSPVVQKIVEKTWQTQNVQDLSNQYWEFKKNYPILADNIEGLLNISQLAPLSPKITKPIVSSVKEAGKVITPNLAKQAKSLSRSADEWFRMQAEEIAVPNLKEMGIRDKTKIAWDVVETKWFWPFKKQEIVRSPQEALAIEETARLLKEGKVKKWVSEIKNAEAVGWEIWTLANELRSNIMQTAPDIKIKKTDVENLFTDISKRIEDNPVMRGDIKESANKLVEQLKKNLNKEDYNGIDILDLRQKLDSDIAKYVWDSAFDPKIETAFTSAFKEFRQGLNGKISELAPNAEVRNLLDRQSALFRVKENLETKWTRQANSTVGRLISKVQNVTGVPRTEIIELATALGLLWAWALSSVVNPIATAVTVWMWAKAIGKRILSPANKAKLSSMLSKLDDYAKKNPSQAKEIEQIKQTFNQSKNVWTTSNIRGDSNSWPSAKSVKYPTKTTVNLQQSKGGFIRLPWFTSKLNTKPQPKRLFAWENSAQPPKSKTGWFKWADGKMRFEIDDSVAKIEWKWLKKEKIESNSELTKWTVLPFEYTKWDTKLWDILKHDELFKQYPELKDVNVSYIVSPNSKTEWGRFNQETNTIVVTAKYPEQGKSTLLHEIQHSIQEKEWFARGGSANESSLKAAEKYWYNTDKTFKEIADIYNKINQDHIEWRITWAERMMKRMSLEQKFEKEIKDFTIWEYEAYKRLAWEVEARNVQTRMNMTRAERTKTSPIVTEEKDVPRAKQIIRMDSKWPAMSMRRPYTLQANKPIVKRASDLDKTISDEAKSYWQTFESLEKEFDWLLDKYLAIPRKLTKEVWDNVSSSDKFVWMLWWNDLDYSAGIKLKDMWYILVDAPWLFEKIPVAEKPLVLEYLRQNQWPTYSFIVNKLKSTSPKPISEWLMQEARKYKSAKRIAKKDK